MTNWQFNVLFFVGVGGAVLILLGPEFGLDFGSNPTAVSGVGAILAYILTQKKALTRNHQKDENPPEKEVEEDGPR